MLETVLDQLADSFLSIGVYVAAFVALFGWIRARWGGRFENWLSQNTRWGPLVGAIATMPPGCVGVFLITALYGRGRVSFGCAVAALLATMGDSAWVMLASNPELAVELKLLFLVIGASCGYLVDRLGISPQPLRTSRGPSRVRATSVIGCGCSSVPRSVGDLPMPQHRGTQAGGPTVSLTGCAGAADPHPHSQAVGVRVPAPVRSRIGGLTAVAAAVCAGGLIVTLPVTLQLADEEQFAEYLGGLDLYKTVGILGFVVALMVITRNGFRFGCEESIDADSASMAKVIRQAVRESSFVTVWVGAAFVSWELIAGSSWVGAVDIPTAGIIGVLIGAAAGLVPSCGVEVLFAALFVAGGVSLPTMVAYLVSMDGSGFFPLMARSPRAAVTANVITTVVAIAVGLAFLVAS